MCQNQCEEGERWYRAQGGGKKNPMFVCFFLSSVKLVVLLRPRRRTVSQVFDWFSTVHAYAPLQQKGSIVRKVKILIALFSLYCLLLIQMVGKYSLKHYF